MIGNTSVRLKVLAVFVRTKGRFFLTPVTCDQDLRPEVAAQVPMAQKSHAGHVFPIDNFFTPRKMAAVRYMFSTALPQRDVCRNYAS